MIGPTTRLFGLAMSDPAEGHVARLYNALFGFNGLDAAYLTFLVKPAQLAFTLTGFKTTGQTEVLHVAPAHQRAAGQWLGLDGAVDTLWLRGEVRGALRHADAATWLAPEGVAARALAEAQVWFDRPLDAPADWLDVVRETRFRPCKLTHDVFGRTSP
ncbi:MAG: hypothetical protein ACOZQL_35075 [Myxococcota bacterium]